MNFLLFSSLFFNKNQFFISLSFRQWNLKFLLQRTFRMICFVIRYILHVSWISHKIKVKIFFLIKSKNFLINLFLELIYIKISLIRKKSKTVMILQSSSKDNLKRNSKLSKNFFFKSEFSLGLINSLRKLFLKN